MSRVAKIRTKTSCEIECNARLGPRFTLRYKWLHYTNTYCVVIAHFKEGVVTLFSNYTKLNTNVEVYCIGCHSSFQSFFGDRNYACFYL